MARRPRRPAHLRPSRPTREPAADGAAPGGEPTVQYEEALAHESRSRHVHARRPGDRGLHAADRTTAGAVGGATPRALPAGNATGDLMAIARQGSIWSSRRAVRSAALSRPPNPADPTDPVDGPAGGPVAGDPLVASAPEPDVATPDAVAKGLQRQVFGFLPYWTLADKTTVLDYDYLSTIAYFSVGADRLGNLLKRGANGKPTTGWGGWTSKRMTSVINAAHAHHTRVVLTISVFAWTSGQAARQATLLGSPAARRNLARQVAAAVRDRGADGINLDFEPIASGHADDFTALVRTVRKELEPGPPGLPAHVRHDRLDRQLPGRGRDPAGRRRRDLHHGLRLPRLRRLDGRVHRPARRPELLARRHDQGLHGPRAGVQAHPGAALLRPGLVYDDERPARPEPEWREVRHVHLGHVQHRPGTGEGLRAALRRERRSHLVPLRAPELHGDLRLRDELAAGLLRRRPVAQGALRPGRAEPAPGRRDLGPRLRRARSRALRRDLAQVPARYDATRGGDRDPAGHDRRCGLRRLLARRGRLRDPLVRRPRLGGRRSVEDLAMAHQGDLGRVPRRGRSRLRVPGPGDGRARQRGRLGRHGTLRWQPDARPRRVRSSPGGRPLGEGLAGYRRAQGRLVLDG